MYNPDYNGIENKGWVCSRCGRSLAPWQSGCPYCNDSRVVYAVNTTGLPVSEQRVSTKLDMENSVNTIANDMSVNTMSWRDWLDEMRATNWRHDYLKREE